ncbi:cytochrome P450 [Aeromicrobium sp. CTD01-1L150]|uniref:cytochrome P450 n=1 Tax=Aeromicrobium sp. CTD01-1L150 TaxID=3341830 RepID=UPI0035BF0883
MFVTFPSRRAANAPRSNGSATPARGGRLAGGRSGRGDGHGPCPGPGAARATRDVTWDGVAIPAGCPIIHDVWRTNHHPTSWPAPHRFDPGRFSRTARSWSWRDTSHAPRSSGANSSTGPRACAACRLSPAVTSSSAGSGV